MTRKCTILGCGPAGLLAAHAAVQNGYDPTIISNKKKSPIGGAQYLHASIPGLTSSVPDADVEYLKFGTREGYAEKVYGNPEAVTSWDGYEGTHPIWNMRKLYDDLWKLYSELVRDTYLDPDRTDFLLGRWRDQGPVFSTVPAPVLCRHRDRHTFIQQDVWILYHESEWARGDHNIIVYDGTKSMAWYRNSILFNWYSAEYPSPIRDAQQVRKPLYTDCDCHRGVIRLGRYGKFEKSALIHHAYEEAGPHLRLVDADAVV